jgi:Flp pilus assembly protein TadG
MRVLNKLLTNDAGNVLMIGAAAAPLLIGAAAMGIDVVQLSLSRSQLQRSADTASLAGAFALVQGKPAGESVARALTLNNPALTVASTVENAPAAGPYAGDARAVRVLLSVPGRRHSCPSSSSPRRSSGSRRPLPSYAQGASA